VLAAQQEEVEQFFSPIVGRARVREGIHALQAARELTYVHVGGRVMLQVSSLQPPLPAPDGEFKLRPRFEPRPPERGKPLVQRRPRRTAVPAKPRPSAEDASKE
jgi:hypothetical protein